ncbi:uncharacterized protein LOC118181029 [Stegodyphus dumicola]|uniref:uncharacterized protein LOC118181029 n=1 Tax=Stegodyphus dumicola TaxID=202533 RepID=UPI0015B1B0D1|nr:uncharacterized protein LOC118181029 [Stegodyphus dumicola]
MAFLHLSSLFIAAWILCLIVAASGDQIPNEIINSHALFSESIPKQLKAMHRQSKTLSFVDVIMYGLAGIPVYKAVGFLLPFLKAKRPQVKDDPGRVLNRHHRGKRDLAYAQQLLNLLISVEVALEKYGITEPQCQLRATCEIHRKSANEISSGLFERNFIKLVGEMRREIQNPRVVPLAKYVFEYYEEAAIRGEQQCNCGEMYPRCLYSLDYFMKRTKGKRTQGQSTKWKTY